MRDEWDCSGVRYWREKKKVVGDTGFEPVTSTVCRRHRKKPRRRK